MKTKIKKPHEVRQEQVVNLEPLCEELRQTINKVFANDRDGRRSYTVAVDKFPRGVIAIVKGECQSAGWLVNEEEAGDQRDSYHNLVMTKNNNVPDHCR